MIGPGTGYLKSWLAPEPPESPADRPELRLPDDAEARVLARSLARSSARSALARAFAFAALAALAALLAAAAARAAAARRAGMIPIYQEPSLIPDLDVADNLRLGDTPREPFLHWVSELGVTGLRLDERIRDLPLATLRVLDLARALAAEPLPDERGPDPFWRPAMTAAARMRHTARRVLPSLMPFVGLGDDGDVLFSSLEYGLFRDFLAPASGFQSGQLRLVQRALGKGPLLGLPLFPGDIISPGTPGAIQVRPGDVVECRIPGVGTLTNRVVRG